jgi:hypothetical protein
LVITPLVFWGAWYIAPGLLDGQSLKWLAGSVSVLWGLEFYFFQRLSAVSSVDGLSSREHERLVFRLAAIRKRIWWIGGVGLASSFVIWILATMNLPTNSPLYAGAAGFLVGVSLSYMVLIPGWLNESHDFIDEAKRQDTLAKKRVEATKALKPE